MKAIVVIEFECSPDDLPEILDHINPPRIPHFHKRVRVAIDDPKGEDIATQVLDWLDEE